MANTSAGRRLTDAHRRAQIEAAKRPMAQTALAFDLLDISDLDGSAPLWTTTTSRIAATGYEQSQVLATSYLSAYREAELGTTTGPLVNPPIDAARVTTALRISGPVGIKQSIARGVDPVEAWEAARTRMMGVVQQVSLNGGRRTIDFTGRSDRRSRGRYRRVSDARPCSFCAMLVTRGPVYKEDTAYFQSHPRCGCTAELVYGDWEPTALEQKWVDAYQQAAEEASRADGRRVAPKPTNAEDTVLWRMRRDDATTGLFSDHWKPKSQ